MLKESHLHILTGYNSLIVFKLHQQTISPIFGIVMLFVGIFIFSILNKLFEIYAPTIVDINYLCRIDSIIKDIVRKYNKRKNIIQDIVENDKLIEELIEELKREIIDYLETEKSLKNISIYELADCIGWLDNIPEIYMYDFPIDLYMIMDGKEIPLTMGGMSSSMFTKLNDNTIYINIRNLRKLLPRMGYLINADDKNFSINVKSYDFNKEKEIFLKTFPVEKFGESWYSKKYDRYLYEEYFNFYLCDDFYFNQYNCTEAIEDSYKVYIDNNYRQMYSYDNEKAYKDLLQAAYYTYIDDEIKVKYDEDLDAYIIYNKEYDNVSKLDDTYKILVVRKYDNMIMFQYWWYL